MFVIYSARRFIQAALLLIPLAAVANPLYIEGLMNQKNKYPAPAALKGFMANEERRPSSFALKIRNASWAVLKISSPQSAYR